MKIRMLVDGTEEATEKLKKFAARINEVSALAEAFGEVLSDSMKKNIIESHTPWGEPFLPLKSKSAEQGQNRKGVSAGMTSHAGKTSGLDRVSDVPLRKTDTLLDSIMADVGKTTLGYADMIIGHHVRYGDWQNFGTDRIPARTFMGISSDSIVTGSKMTRRFAMNALSNSDHRMDIYEDE